MLDEDVERAILDHLFDGVYLVDRERRIRYWNAAAERLSGFPSATMVGRFCHDNLLNHVDAAGRQLCREGCPLSATMTDGAPREADVFLHHVHGHRVPVRVRTSAVRDPEGQIVGAVEVFSEGTPQSAARREMDELRDLAMLDPLTGLPNRRHLEMSLASRTAQLAGYGRRFGLLLADVDAFKDVNDRLGHVAGDAALATVARTLLGSTRPSDDIARFGGDEFVITIADPSAASLIGVAERFRALVERSTVRSGEVEIGVTISIGAALARPGEAPESLLGRADAALYRAKADGRNRVRLDPEDVDAG